MIRSKRRAVVFPQAEHARLAASLAAAWGNADFPRPSLPFDSFVRGVALHDRGYGEVDDDDLGAIDEERWLEIQRRGFQRRGDDPVVDLVVGLHVRRLVGSPPDSAGAALAREMEAALPALAKAGGVSAEDAAAADSITDLCDRIALRFCAEESASGVVTVASASASIDVAYAVDDRGTVIVGPWPFAMPSLAGVVAAFEADSYPRRLEPVPALFRAEPAPAAPQ